jgi:hypothetical protein
VQVQVKVEAQVEARVGARVEARVEARVKGRGEVLAVGGDGRGVKRGPRAQDHGP